MNERNGKAHDGQALHKAYHNDHYLLGGKDGKKGDQQHLQGARDQVYDVRYVTSVTVTSCGVGTECERCTTT